MNILRVSKVLAALMMFYCHESPGAAYEREDLLLELRRLEAVKAIKGEMKPGHLTLLGMTLGESTLSDVKQRFGPAEQISIGHDGVLVCYRSVQQDDHSMVVFGARIHGDEKLFNFQLISGQQPFKSKARCIPSHYVSKETATQSGLKLGLTAGSVRKIWDEPMTEKRGHLFIDYDYHKATTFEEGPACIMSFTSSVIRFEEDALSWLMVTRGEEFYRGPCIR